MVGTNSTTQALTSLFRMKDYCGSCWDMLVNLTFLDKPCLPNPGYFNLNLNPFVTSTSKATMDCPDKKLIISQNTSSFNFTFKLFEKWMFFLLKPRFFWAWGISVDKQYALGANGTICGDLTSLLALLDVML